MLNLQGIRPLVISLPALVGLMLAWFLPTSALASGCRPELVGGSRGAQVSAQILERDRGGDLVALSGPSTEIEARSGQFVRLFVRPIEGSAEPAGFDCAVRVSLGRLTSVARQLTSEGFVSDRGFLYGQFRPDEERVLDFEIKPFEEWGGANEQVSLENIVIKLPQTLDFVARLPSPYEPPLGSVCADVVHPDAQPAIGVTLALAAPPDGPADKRLTGSDGRVCWDGFDELLFGELSLEPSSPAALGQPSSRYVSRLASYRLFVVKRLR